MRGDELVQDNLDKILRIDVCLGMLSVDLQIFELTMRSWLDDTRPSKSRRKDSADELCFMLEELEIATGATIPTKKILDQLMQSEEEEDWRKVLQSTLPKLRDEVLAMTRHALVAIKSPQLPVWSDLLPEEFADQVLPHFRDGHYLSSLRRGCDALRAMIRSKTGLHHLDGAALVNQAFGDKGHFVLEVWESHSEDDVRRGYFDMLRGAMTGIRNPHYHGTEELPEAEAARLLVVLGTLWARVETTRPA